MKISKEFIVSILTISVAVCWFVIAEMVPRFVRLDVIRGLLITSVIFWYLSCFMFLVKLGHVVIARKRHQQHDIRPLTRSSKFR